MTEFRCRLELLKRWCIAFVRPAQTTAVPPQVEARRVGAMVAAHNSLP